MAGDEIRTAALVKETQIFQLHQTDHWIIIVGFHKVHIVRCASCLVPKQLPVMRPATAKLDWILGKPVMTFDNSKGAHCRQTKPVSGFGVHY